MTRCIPKFIGEEIELGHHVLDPQSENPALDAGVALTFAHHELYGRSGKEMDPSLDEFDSDAHRFYLDHGHFEANSALMASAYDLVLSQRDIRAKIVRCKEAAEKRVGAIRVYFDNTNRRGVSWGGHANVMIARETFFQWSDNDWLPLMKQWVPFICSSPPLFGAGKTGAEKNAPPSVFQLSQRSDHLDRVVGYETVESKSLINTRDESHARSDRYFRYHIICFDIISLELSRFLKFGCIQILLALLEEKYPLPELTLASPLDSMAIASRDLTMRAPLSLESGASMTALEIQYCLAERVSKAIQDGSAASAVPDARHIASLWVKTLDDLKNDSPLLARRLDWRARLEVLRRAQSMPGASVETVELADLNFGELDGAFALLDNSGAVDRLEDFLPHRSPRDSRPIPREEARGLLLRRFHAHLERVDWDRAFAKDSQGRTWEIRMDDPLDSRALLHTVQHAKNWTSCLDNLAKQGSATRLEPTAIVLVDETQPQEDESNEKLATKS